MYTNWHKAIRLIEKQLRVSRTLRWKTNVSRLKIKVPSLPVSWWVETVESRPNVRRRNIVLDRNLHYTLMPQTRPDHRDLEKDWILTVYRASFARARALVWSSGSFQVDTIPEDFGQQERWSERFALVNEHTSRLASKNPSSPLLLYYPIPPRLRSGPEVRKT